MGFHLDEGQKQVKLIDVDNKIIVTVGRYAWKTLGRETKEFVGVPKNVL